MDTYGMTPLHRMASNNLPVGAKALLEAKADPNNRGQARASPMEIAKDSRAREVMAVIAEYMSKPQPVFFAASRVELRSGQCECHLYRARPTGDPGGFQLDLQRAANRDAKGRCGYS